MAIFASLVLLAQNTSSTINDNLQATENQLQNANQELDLLKEQYNHMLTQTAENSFFNFGNLYFWFVLVGLLLLAFGLLFLLAELQNKDRSKKSKVESIKTNKEESIDEKEAKKLEDDEEVEADTEEAIVEEEPELARESAEEKVAEELVEEEDDEADEQPAKKMDKPIKIKVEKVK